MFWFRVVCGQVCAFRVHFLNMCGFLLQACDEKPQHFLKCGMLRAGASLWNCFEMRQLNCSEHGDGVSCTFVQLLEIIVELL